MFERRRSVYQYQCERDGYENAISEADRLLYRAKSKGRNRVEGGTVQSWRNTSYQIDTSQAAVEV